MSGKDGGWPPRYRKAVTPEAAYFRVRVTWFGAAVAFLAVGLYAVACGSVWGAFAAGVLLGVTVRLALRRLPGRRR